ncbi:MAG: CinA family protein, partial [Chloroflexi bacterium]|nr:CinA family protein [Chloroflexota bacterium]
MEPLQPMAENIAGLLRERGETVAICETTAGGLVSAALLSIPGASRYYAGAAVTYTGVARSTFLEIELDDYPGVRSSSAPYAMIIAETIRERLGATWGVGETGAA